MINKKNAKLFCKEDIYLIENYDKASKDLLEVWDIHHRKEDEGYSKQELIDKGMYYKRPASELKFLTKKEHVSLHMKGNKYSSGEKHPFYGKHRSEETRKKISETLFKPVNQIDKNTGQVIKTWSCAKEVRRVLGVNNRNISACCSGKRKSAGGYIWRYA